VIIPEPLFAFALWAAIGGVACGAVYLLAALVSEWRRGRLW
jgi:hypothetical protein